MYFFQHKPKIITQETKILCENLQPVSIPKKNKYDRELVTRLDIHWKFFPSESFFQVLVQFLPFLWVFRSN